MSRDIGHSRRGVEASGCGSEDRRRSAHRHRGGGRVRDLPSTSAPAAGPLPGRRTGRGRAAFAATERPTRGHTGRGPGPDHQLRQQLTGQGLDAGPVTIAWHLEREGLPPPSTSTIRRILHAAGLVIPEPRKRPRSSYIRFEAAQPNETWQSDFTHWRLADGTDVEILNWLDDHSRFLLSCTAHQPVTGDDVVTTFLAATDQHGVPASTLTDNGRVYTARFGGGRNAFEYLLPLLGYAEERLTRTPANPRKDRTLPPDPETLARRAARPRPPSPNCNASSTGSATTTTNTAPTAATTAPPPATPTGQPRKPSPPAPREGHYRLRYDHVDTNGKMSLRRAGRMHHLGIGADHRGKRILALIDETTVTVIHLDTGEILSTHHINPTRSYWRNQQQEPGRWPGS